MSQSAKNIINRIKKEIGIKTDKALCDLLNIKSNTLSSWKKRDTLDFSKVIALCNAKNLDLNMIFFGEPEIQKETDTVSDQYEDLSTSADLLNASFVRRTKTISTNRNISVVSYKGNTEMGESLLLTQKITPITLKEGSFYIVETTNNKIHLLEAVETVKKNHIGPVPVKIKKTNCKFVEKNIHLSNIKAVWYVLEKVDNAVSV